MTSSPRVRVRRLGLVAVIMVAFGAGFAAPASAHTTLLESTPAKGASVRELTEVRLVFSENVQPSLVRVQLRDARGPREESAAAPQVTGATVRQPVAPGLPAGAYTLVYRVVSADGHPVTGEVPFTLIGSAKGATTGAAPAAAPPSDPAADPDAPAAATDPDDGARRWMMLGGGLLFGILIGLGFVVLRRPRQEPSGGE